MFEAQGIQVESISEFGKGPSSSRRGPVIRSTTSHLMFQLVQSRIHSDNTKFDIAEVHLLRNIRLFIGMR